LRDLIISNLNGQNSIETKNTKNPISLDCATFKFIGMFSFNYERTIIYSAHYKMLANAGIGAGILQQYQNGIMVPLYL